MTVSDSGRDTMKPWMDRKIEKPKVAKTESEWTVAVKSEEWLGSLLAAGAKNQ